MKSTPVTKRPAPAVSVEERRHATRVVRGLRREYPEATCALKFDSPVQLLVATILSAQCTDERVNQVTEKLFDRYPAAADLAAVSPRTLERLIRSTGFFRSKARHIKACCQRLVDEHGGDVPRDMDVLTQLPGVGRKTANVVLGTAFGIASGVVVDTHVARISRRLGLTAHADPARIEEDLRQRLPRKEWIDYAHRLIHHGRRICKARRPLCQECSLQQLCPRVGVAP